MISIRSIFCTLLLLLLSKTAVAQHTYIPIPQDSATWITVKEDWHEGEPPQPHTFTYLVGKTMGVDTVIDNITCACFFEEYYTDLPLSNPPPAYMAEWFYQDTVAKKVWWVRTTFPQLTVELLYDFSLQIGDTITDTNDYFLNYIISPNKSWVDDIDSVYFPDGTWRYRWWIKANFSNGIGQATATIIEGMGFTTGFYKNPYELYKNVVSLTDTVVCFGVNDQWLYEIPNPWNVDCDSMHNSNALKIAAAKQNDLNKPLLYPNPVAADNSLFINSYSGKGLLTVEAYDLSGKKVLSTIVKAGESIPLSGKGLLPGLYFFRLSDSADHVIHTQKILVQ